MEGTRKRQLSVELPSGPAVRWIARIVRLAWIPFSLAIVGRWLGSGLDVLSSSLLAFAVVQLGGKGENGLPIPDVVMAWIRASKSPLSAALLLALGITLFGRLFQTLVQWCLTWTHLLVNRKVTPEVVEASLEPATHRLLDPSTMVQRWLLKVDLSFFIHESVAETIGDIGTVLIILIVTFKANVTAGNVALGGLVLWVAIAVPLIVYALRASRRSAQAHETVGRIIRDGAALRAELGRPSLRTYWRQRHLSPMKELQAAIKWQGIWNAQLFGFLGLISFALPIVAVIASSATGSAGSALAVLLYLTRMSGPLDSLATTLPWVQQNLISVQRLFQVVETDRDRVVGAPAAYSPQEIEVRDWSVSLPDGSRIQYPDQTARRGTILIIVGPSGCGKSSLLASLAGQLGGWAGSLLVDGSSVPPSDPRWREACAFVPQEPELVPGGLMDNLRDFPGWKETPALGFAVTQVLASRSLGSGGEVAIDEKGVSVGQRRAISVLRAIGSGTGVLLLDEPVAGVGDALVRPIREALLEANAQGRLILMTAHQHDLERLALGSMASVLQLKAT
jgi:ABC-type multidrug transport system fused ATPase/permease subunit